MKVVAHNFCLFVFLFLFLTVSGAIKTVSIVGLGFIGLPRAIIAAESGYRVYGFDINKNRVARINVGEFASKEPGLMSRLQGVIASKTFSASTKLIPADCYLFAVPTLCGEDNKPDLSALFDAATRVAHIMKPGTLIIIESTIPVGTTQRVAKLLEIISELENNKDFFVVHSPEGVASGNILHEFVHQDRIVGGMSEHAGNLAATFYKDCTQGQIDVTDSKSAEMIKLIQNGFRDMQIAFANQVSNLCEKEEIDGHTVIKLANKHPRTHILSPGCGVGGHCITVTPWFLIKKYGESIALLQTARTINDARPYQVIDLILEKVKRVYTKNKKPRVLILGLTFKPNAEDDRYSPALHIAQTLLDKKDAFELCVCEPHLSTEKIKSYGFDFVASNIVSALQQADVVVALVKHDVFKELAPDSFQGKIIVDTCGLVHELC